MTVEPGVKLRVMKFDGDDMYSYAVFRAADVKGMRSPIFAGQARPVRCGMGKQQADAYKARMLAARK
jgi:hypothetical protein